MQGGLSHLIGSWCKVVSEELKVKAGATLHVQVAHRLSLAAQPNLVDLGAETH